MAQRALMPDYLRLIALFGIVVVNVQVMASPFLTGFWDASTIGAFDLWVIGAVDGLLYLKTYGLFSFMFGVGLALQMQAAARRGLVFGPLYRKRMIGLFLLGLAHGCLFFTYDILLLYALTGGLLYPLRHWPALGLLRLGVGLLATQIVIASVLALGPPPPQDVMTLERQVMTGGSLIDVVIFRTRAFVSTFPFLILFQGFSALGWFCLGLAAVKQGMIDCPTHPNWLIARSWFLAPGVGLSLAAVVVTLLDHDVIGAILLNAAAPLATIGYLGVIAALAYPPGKVGAVLLQAGGASLSVYLGQSILLTSLFAPYGLGLWDRVTPTQAVGLAMGVTVLLIFAMGVWRSVFQLGPFEMLLRRITYGRRQNP